MPTRAPTPRSSCSPAAGSASVPAFFKVEGFRVNVERRHDANGRLKTVAEAVVKVDRRRRRAHVGRRRATARSTRSTSRCARTSASSIPWIDDLELVDYKVRILNGGTEAVTRVLIESRDAEGNRWFTVGVSANIIDASFEALLDAVTYKLLKASDAPARSAAE